MFPPPLKIERLSPATERAATEYLARSPHENVFLSYLVMYDFAPMTRTKIFVALEGREVRGVVYFGRQLALAGDAAALAAFSAQAKRHRGERMILGPRETVEHFWELVRSWHPRPRAVRERQLVMLLDDERLRSFESGIAVRHARPDEWAAIADSSARMIEQELEYDPRRTSPDFSANIRQMIENHLWWVGAADGQLCFYCNIGPWCRQTAQLQGIWTPPPLRGMGLATAALAAICKRMLDVTPTVSLYVNDYNEKAIALYRRVGFEHVSDFQTLLF